MSCEWLTVPEAATWARVTTDSIYRWVRLGLIEAGETPGGTIRLCKESLISKKTIRGKLSLAKPPIVTGYPSADLALQTPPGAEPASPKDYWGIFYGEETAE